MGDAPAPIHIDRWLAGDADHLIGTEFAVGAGARRGPQIDDLGGLRRNAGRGDGASRRVNPRRHVVIMIREMLWKTVLIATLFTISRRRAGSTQIGSPAKDCDGLSGPISTPSLAGSASGTRDRANNHRNWAWSTSTWASSRGASYMEPEKDNSASIG